MVEKISELNRMCQKPDYRTVGNRMVRHFERPAALYLTWVLLHTPVTAHQVTAACFGVAALAAVLLARPDAGGFFWGAFAWQCWYLLDHVDGQIARYRKSVSLEGLFSDYFMHHVATLLFTFGAGWGLYRLSGRAEAIFLGYLASVSLTLIGILNDCQSKTFFTALLKSPGLWRAVPDPMKAIGAKPKGLSAPRRLFALFHKSCEGHVVMNVYTVFAIARLVPPMEEHFTENIFWALMIYHAFCATFVWSAKAYYRIARAQISSEFTRFFHRS